MWVLSYLVWRCDISVEFKHLTPHIVVSSLFDTPSIGTSMTPFPPYHPVCHVATRFDDVTTHTPTMLPAVVGFQCSVCLRLHAHVIVISASVLITTLAPQGKIVLSFPP